MTTQPWLCYFEPAPEGEEEIGLLSRHIRSLLQEISVARSFFNKWEAFRPQVANYVSALKKVREAVQALENLPKGVAQKPALVDAKEELRYFLESAEKLFGSVPVAVLKPRPTGRPVQYEKIVLLINCEQLLRAQSYGRSLVKDGNIIGLARWAWKEATVTEDFSDAAWRHTLKALRRRYTPPTVQMKAPEVKGK